MMRIVHFYKDQNWVNFRVWTWFIPTITASGLDHTYNHHSNGASISAILASKFKPELSFQSIVEFTVHDSISSQGQIRKGVKSIAPACKRIGLIPDGGSKIYSFLSTVPGLNLSSIWFYSKLRPFQPLEFIPHRVKCYKIIIDSPSPIFRHYYR